MEDSKVYSIGYSSFNQDEFIEVLKSHQIDCLIDVRSNPFSQYHVDYNKNTISDTLNKNGILYRNYKTEFGARQDDKSFYCKEGYLDFERFIASPQFHEGISKIKAGIDLGYRFCLMCAETDPINCHRSIMVGRGLLQSGIIVSHILKSRSSESQHDIEQRMLDIYFKNRNQTSLFENAQSEAEMILECYRRRNQEIGYRKDDE